MAKRLFLMLVVVAALLTGLGFLKFKQVQSAMAAGAYTPPPEAVTSVVVKREQWPSTTAVIGTMEAVHGVMVSADLPGTVAKINFDSGKAVRAGRYPGRTRYPPGARPARRPRSPAGSGEDQLRTHEQLVKEGVISRSEYDQPAPSKSRRKRMWAKSAPPSSARRSARRFRECWGFARLTLASIYRPEAR